jgi:hypothetical protein
MMDNEEIAWLLLQILRDTRTYLGVAFECYELEGDAQLRYAKGLFTALPESEKREVESLFNQIYTSASLAREVEYLATHPAPRAMQ